MVNADIKRIRFFYLDRSFYFPFRSRLKNFLLELFTEEGQKVDAISYIFCSDEYLSHLNKLHLSHDTFTDIITFPYTKKGEPVQSDIYISIDRIRENSKLYKNSFLTELHRVIFHGALHLCGFKDKNTKDQEVMREKENYYLDRFHVPRDTVSQRNTK